MACNCKRKRKFEEVNGIPINDTILAKAKIFGLKVLTFVTLLCLSVILVPIIVIVAMYKMAFTKDPTIVIPRLFGKVINDKKIDSDK